MKKVLFVLLIAVTVCLVTSITLLDKYFFLCPVDYRRNISIRADARGNGMFAAPRNGRQHRGLDLFAPLGSPVYACRFGIVSLVQDEKMGMGKYIVIRHFGNIFTLYGHLSQIYVAKNQLVRQGALIGRVGKTGNAASRAIQPHLHFEVHKSGKPQNPLDYLQ